MSKLRFKIYTLGCKVNQYDSFDLRRKLLYVKTKGERTERKMRSRAIPLHKKAIWSYQERRKLNEHEKYVFTTLQGNNFDRNILRKQLKKFLKKAGLKKGNVHTFRHTFASHLVQQGISLYKVRDWLGHTSVKQTEIYSHLIPEPNNAILDENLKFNI